MMENPMKTVMLLLSLMILSSTAFAQYVNTSWQYHPVKCPAQTVCPNGSVITCQTVGFNYGNAPRNYNNMCRSRVVPGYSVHCQGYADQVDIYGRIIFVSANIPVTCY